MNGSITRSLNITIITQQRGWLPSRHWPDEFTGRTHDAEISAAKPAHQL